MNIRRFEIKNEIFGDSTLYVGNTKDIKAMYNSIARNTHTNIYALYYDRPIFSKDKLVYGLEIHGKEMTVVNSDACMKMLLDSGVL